MSLKTQRLIVKGAYDFMPSLSDALRSFRRITRTSLLSKIAPYSCFSIELPSVDYGHSFKINTSVSFGIWNIYILLELYSGSVSLSVVLQRSQECYME